jgi:amino acid transporter
LLRYFAAAALALPAGAIGWFELAYLFFGITGEDPPRSYNVVAALAAFGVAFAWPLFRTTRPAAVVRRSCRVGGIAAVLLPLVTIAVLLMWESSSGRRDLGMGGLMLYSMPVVAFAVALVLALVLWLCDRAAAKRLQSPGAVL